MPLPTPLTWLLLGPKAGDNTQLEALAAELGWPVQRVRLRYRASELLSNLLLRRTLLGLPRDIRASLAPPWPDLVLTAGRRNEPVARWIQAQAAAAGGHTRLVHLGRPWAHPRHFDLVLSTPQYQVPEGPGVLTLDLPLHPPPAAAGVTPLPAEAGIGPPFVTVLLGGHSGAFVYTPAVARRMAASVDALAASLGAGCLVSSSARTPPAAVQAFLDALRSPRLVWRWGQPENPYRRWLGLADALAVGGDSLSMLAEAAATGTPVTVLDPRLPPPWWRHPVAWHWRPLSHRLAQVLAPRRLRRDVTRLWDRLPQADGKRDRAHAATAVRSLFGAASQ